jgi:hypothetical protein
MSFVEGSPVSKRWFDPLWASEEKRLTVLRNLAPLMSQLLTLRFDRIGALSFDDDGNFIRVAEFVRTCDDDCADKHICTAADSCGWSELDGPFDSTYSYLLADWAGSTCKIEWKKAEESALAPRCRQHSAQSYQGRPFLPLAAGL